MLVIGCGLVFSVVVVILFLFFFFFLVSMVVVGLVGWLFFVFSIQGCFNVGGGFFFFFLLGSIFFQHRWWWVGFDGWAKFWFGGVSIVVVMAGFQWLGWVLVVGMLSTNQANRVWGQPITQLAQVKWIDLSPVIDRMVYQNHLSQFFDLVSLLRQVIGLKEKH